MTKEQFTEIVENDINQADRVLNIMELLYRFKKGKVKENKILDYARKYNNEYSVDILTMIENNKFINKLKSKEKVFTVNLEYLSKRLSEFHNTDIKFSD
jgi:hypothetical protein